ncbi:Glycosyl hydrolase family 10 protein [Abeliophyllum distichum]|uniref:Glycosyl hydrolase family 10 protein n=1 Tax=Abeliophyllum distichum TaxID=126358 RepID=A0ABD1RS66_9LAMI
MNSVPLLMLFFLVSSGIKVYSLHYDHTYTHECLAKPMEPQYAGGMVINPELEHGLKGWTTFGQAKIEHQESKDGNKYIVASYRSGHCDSFSQKFYLEEEKLYVLSAWLQVSHGEAHLAAMFRTGITYQPAGWVIARQGCWSMLKGGIVVNSSGPVELFFQANNTRAEIWADSISLQAFTQEEWDSHQDQNIEKIRKGKVKFQVVDPQGRPLANAKISVKQIKQTFPFGNAISKFIIHKKAYQEWFVSRFKYAVFENEMKWYSNERRPGKENYYDSDTMLKFAKRNNILVRGHNVLWDDPRYQPSWVKKLPRKDLQLATEKRINSVMKHYLGQLIHWDVVNENLHFSFYEKRLGRNASTVFLKRAHQIDQKAIPFLNDYNTLESPTDSESTPAKYIEKIKLIREQGYHGPLGIGLEAHFDTPNLPYVRASLDMLASTKLPIWITELDVSHRPKQAMYLAQLIKEFHAHPAIHGIIMWGSWSPTGCWKMCFTDKNFNNLPTGNAVDNIMKVWRHEGLLGTTDGDGYFNTSLFHGDYKVEIRHSTAVNSSKIRQFGVASSDKIQETHFKFHV